MSKLETRCYLYKVITNHSNDTRVTMLVLHSTSGLKYIMCTTKIWTGRISV